MMGRAEIFIDTENLFHGFARKSAAHPLPSSFQEVLLARDPNSTAARNKRVIREVFDLIIEWFAEPLDAGAEILVHSYGKRQDQGVRTLLSALGRRRDPNRFFRKTTTVQQHDVGLERHAAEDAMVAELRAHVERGLRDVAVGGADHDGLQPLNNLKVAQPELRPSVVLPAGSTAFRHVHRLGQYAQLDPDRVVTIAELIAQGNERLHRSKLVSRREADRIETTMREARSEAGETLTAEVEEHLAQLLAVQERGFDRAAPASAAWNSVIAEPWLIEAAATHLRSTVSDAEWQALQQGVVASPRVAHLVLICGFRCLLQEEAVPQEVMAAYLLRVQATYVIGYLRLLSALGEAIDVGARDRG